MKIPAWLAMAACAALAAGCGGGAPKQKLFVMVPKGVHPYYEPCYAGFQAAAAKYGVRTEYQAPLKLEIPQQVETIENLIARKVDGLAISALDDQSLVPVIQAATEAGIKVITFDAPAPSSKALTYIGTVNEEAGYQAGLALAKIMGGEGELAVLQGGLAAPNLNDRFKGLERALKEKAPGVKIVAREDTQGKLDVSLNKTEALLQAHPNLKAIFSVSADGTAGAAPALKEQGKSGRILLAGFDDLPETLDGIRNGTVQFCIAQQTYKMGWVAVEQLLAACEGKALPKEIDTGVVIVTKDNVETYMQDMRKGLGG